MRRQTIEAEPFPESDGEIENLESLIGPESSSGVVTLDEIMEETGLVRKSSDGLGEWKLDARIALLCANQDSGGFDQLARLVKLIDQYQKLVEVQENLEGQYSLYHLRKRIYDAICFFSSILVVSFSAGEALQYNNLTDLMLGFVIALLIVKIKDIGQIQNKAGELLFHGEGFVDGLNEENQRLSPVYSEIDEIYENISACFHELKISWYLRDNMFENAIDHIQAIYKNKYLVRE